MPTFRSVPTATMFLSQYSENERAHEVFRGSCSFILPKNLCLIPDIGYNRILFKKKDILA